MAARQRLSSTMKSAARRNAQQVPDQCITQLVVCVPCCSQNAESRGDDEQTVPRGRGRSRVKQLENDERASERRPLRTAAREANKRIADIVQYETDITEQAKEPFDPSYENAEVEALLRRRSSSRQRNSSKQTPRKPKPIMQEESADTSSSKGGSEDGKSQERHVAPEQEMQPAIRKSAMLEDEDAETEQASGNRKGDQGDQQIYFSSDEEDDIICRTPRPIGCEQLKPMRPCRPKSPEALKQVNRDDQRVPSNSSQSSCCANICAAKTLRRVPTKKYIEDDSGDENEVIIQATKYVDETPETFASNSSRQTALSGFDEDFDDEDSGSTNTCNSIPRMYFARSVTGACPSDHD